MLLTDDYNDSPDSSCLGHEILVDLPCALYDAIVLDDPPPDFLQSDGEDDQPVHNVDIDDTDAALDALCVFDNIDDPSAAEFVEPDEEIVQSMIADSANEELLLQESTLELCEDHREEIILSSLSIYDSLENAARDEIPDATLEANDLNQLIEDSADYPPSTSEEFITQSFDHLSSRMRGQFLTPLFPTIAPPDEDILSSLFTFDRSLPGMHKVTYISLLLFNLDIKK
ncbi:unnamed protein product [Protopolystoma xenopodis]|uniref:Uncharacterized protein n=1 Tax=Protopolystoma xenopodis TaxID=117903 RepID=A0A3S5BRX8_9PLAT|nr:unnamed protein product [Protopolystoma xenopodis]